MATVVKDRPEENWLTCAYGDGDLRGVAYDAAHGRAVVHDEALKFDLCFAGHSADVRALADGMEFAGKK